MKFTPLRGIVFTVLVSLLLLCDRTAAQTSIDAIRDVVHAVRFAVPLKKS